MQSNSECDSAANVVARELGWGWTKAMLRICQSSDPAANLQRLCISSWSTAAQTLLLNVLCLFGLRWFYRFLQKTYPLHVGAQIVSCRGWPCLHTRETLPDTINPPTLWGNCPTHCGTLLLGWFAICKRPSTFCSAGLQRSFSFSFIWFSLDFFSSTCSKLKNHVHHTFHLDLTDWIFQGALGILCKSGMDLAHHMGGEFCQPRLG